MILEGEPGSGKSVALRHLAQHLARKAREVRNPKTATFLIPLYVNLKEFKPAQRPADGPVVRQFILDSLNRINDRDVEAFLEDEFDRGLREGTWLLLLDSFDEIPDVLSSTESDTAVEEYALAVRDFLAGMKQCRAIIASREFRGPKALFRVPRFQIQALSMRQQRDLVQRSGLKPSGQGIVYSGLAEADTELRQMARNPMFLSLVCEYVRRVSQFPPNCNAAYESYINQRLARDEARIRGRFGVGAALVRTVAEWAAYSMAAVTGLGLTPARRELRAELAASGNFSDAEVDRVLDALEYTKLGRSPDDPADGTERCFTFAHRRFQEYFATQVVLREPERISVNELLTNGRWRETAVTILQTQSADILAPMLEEAERLLAPMAADVASSPRGALFAWPLGCRHLLELLDAGLGRVPGGLPAALRERAGKLLRTTWERGRRHNRKTAVSLALIADRDTTIWLIEQAFASGSVMLGGEAYRCVSRLGEPPRSLYQGVRRVLLQMASSRRLREERLTLTAQINRLPEPLPLLRVLRMLSTARYVDFGLGALIVIIYAVVRPSLLLFIAPMVLTSFLCFRPMFGDLAEMMTSNELGSVFFISEVMIRIILFGILAALPIGGNVSGQPMQGTNFALVVFAAILSLYFVTWGFAVRSACYHGKPTGGAGWPLAPILFLARCVPALGRREHRKYTAVVLAGTTVIIVLAIMANPYIQQWSANSGDSEHILIGLIAGVSSAFLWLIYYIPAMFIRDWRVAHGLKIAPQLPGSTELLDLLERVNTVYGCGVVLDVMRKTDLKESPEIVRFLSDLVAVIETRLLRQKIYDVSRLDLEAELAEWIDVYRKRKGQRVLLMVADATLDRVARAIEDAEVARQMEAAKQGGPASGIVGAIGAL